MIILTVIFASIGSPLNIELHSYDMNASIKNFIIEEHPETINQNDTRKKRACYKTLPVPYWPSLAQHWPGPSFGL
jgi:hypothetical protein